MKRDRTPGPNSSASADRTTGLTADSAGGRPGVAGEQEHPWHTLPAEEVARPLTADATSGLTDGEAARRREQFGPNALTAAQGRSGLAILTDQFKSLIVGLLLVVTAVAFALGENVEAVAVLVVIVLNAAVGFLTEWKAEQALTALQRQAVPTAHVLRGVRNTKSPRPSSCPATSSSSPPGRGCPPTGG